MFSPHLNKLRTFVTTSPRRDHTTASKQPTHLHDHCSPHRDHTTVLNNTMKLTCAAHHAATLAVSDAYDDLLSIYRKNKNKEISKKQKASIQASIKAFFKK